MFMFFFFIKQQTDNIVLLVENESNSTTRSTEKEPVGVEPDEIYDFRHITLSKRNSEIRKVAIENSKSKKKLVHVEIIPLASHGRGVFASFCIVLMYLFIFHGFISLILYDLIFKLVFELALLLRCYKHGNRDEIVKCCFCKYGESIANFLISFHYTL